MSEIENRPAASAGEPQDTPQALEFRSMLERLQHALGDEPIVDADHQRCRASMPAMATAEIAGQSVARLFPFETRHLDVCLACAEEYGELVDTLLELEQAEAPPAIAAPQLPAHIETAMRIRAWVTRTARQVLDRAHGLSGDVDLMFATMLEHLPDLSALAEPRQVAQFALGYGAEDDETPLILATWYTTQRLASEYSASDLGALADRQELVARARQVAEETAKQLKLERADRRAFVDAYVDSVMADTAAYSSLGRQA